MIVLFEYLLQVSFILALFYAIYYLILRNERFFVEIRIYLIISILLSLLLPFVRIPYTVIVETVQASVQSELIPMFSGVMDVEPTKQNYFTMSNMLLIGYLIVVAVLLILSLLKISQICRLVLGKKYTIIEGCKLVILDKYIPAFTFFGYIVMTREEFTDESRTNILAHEKVHADQKHWIDLLLVELLTILVWFNPIVWLYQVAIKQTHELLADDGVIARGFNIGQYQATLINQLMGTEVLGLANNFNHSITKKRMIMMSNVKSPKNRRYKLLIMIPAVLAVLLFNMQIVEVQAQEKKIEKKENIGLDGEKVFVTVDQMPEYPGGAEALQKYIAESAKYPSDAINKGISGRVFVTFVVNKEGNIEQACVIRGVDPSLDTEALRVINTVPKWTPGYEKGEAVNVAYTVPINFDFEDEEKNKGVEQVKEVNLDSIDEKVFVTVDKMPIFPGGPKALQNYIATTVKYPSEAFNKGVKGRVFVTFVVNKEGVVDQARVIRGVESSLDAEALRVVESIPKWTPGYEKGKAVSVAYTVPINFDITDDEKIEEVKLDGKNKMDGVAPQFPGGVLELQKFVARTVKYPKEAQEKGEKGRVFVTFIISKLGAVEKVHIAKSVSPLLDAEALRVIKTLPNWTPGSNNGEPVETTYTLPINFDMNDDQGIIVVDKAKNEESNKEKVFVIVEKMPEFPGGHEAMRKYISEKVQYPAEALKNGIKGRVFVTFVVNKEGHVDQARVVRGVEASLNAEALRVINSLPIWKPGYEKGEAVNVSYTVPINFDFTEDE